MATATLTTKGQLTLPAEVRKRLNLKSGDRIDFVFEPGGELVLRTGRKPFERLRGMLKSPHKRPPTIEEMDAAVADGLARDDERIKQQWNWQSKGASGHK
jgi:antitoxin PrlF